MTNDKTPDQDVVDLVVIAIVITIVFAFLASVGYVIVHFIGKYW